jgi:hypothetical protein
MSSVDAIIEIDRFSEWIGLHTSASKAQLALQLQEWNDEKTLYHLSDKCKRFKTAFEKDPTFFPKCDEIFKECSEIETRLNTLINNDSKLENESYNEILFLNSYMKPFNFLPFVLSLWACIRVYILPGISLLIPILTIIAPYLILKLIFNIPITLENYITILHSMVTGTFQQTIDSSGSIIQQSFSPGALLKQFGIVIVTCLQGIIQPYWTHKHLKSIDTIVQENGALILRYKELYNTLYTLLEKNGFKFFTSPFPPLMKERDAVAKVILEPVYFRIALKYIGSLEVLMKIVHQKDIHPVEWVKTRSPVFILNNTYDFQVHEHTRKTISAHFTKQRHALLTGPNKGGKSTVLRALSISALLAHTYGCTIGYAKMSPFKKLYVCLKPDDLPGSKSRFEREIEFTANTLKTDGFSLIFIDELYHSTNPPDALRSCEIYCEQLWNKSDRISVISTHLFELVEKADPSIQRLCCPATVDKNGEVTFMYYMTQGICKVSSVDTLLKMNGLM